MSAVLKIQDEFDQIDWLGRVLLFQDLDIKALKELSQLMEWKRFSQGVSIIKEGEDGHEAYFLISGSLKVIKSTASGESFPVALLHAMDHPFFGEAALLQSDERSATIISETDCDCLVLKKSNFDSFAAQHPEWALPIVLKIARVIVGRLRKANNDVVLLYHALMNEVKGWTG